MINIKRHGASLRVHDGYQLVGQEADSRSRPNLDHYAGDLGDDDQADISLDIDTLVPIEDITCRDELIGLDEFIQL